MATVSLSARIIEGQNRISSAALLALPSDLPQGADQTYARSGKKLTKHVCLYLIHLSDIYVLQEKQTHHTPLMPLSEFEQGKMPVQRE